MIRIFSALVLVALAAIVAAVQPALAVIAVLLGGSVAVLIAGLSARPRATPRAAIVPPSPALTGAPVIDAISEPVLLVVDGRVRIANQAARTLLGGHIVGEDVRLAIRHPAAAERLAATGLDGGTELVGLGGSDQRVMMQVATIAPGQRIVHLIDRTTRYAAERARIDFVANASHELRTPLAAIIGFIETLDDEDAGADAAVRARFLSVMMKEGRRMQRLIDDLISLSRIEAEKYTTPDSPIALAPLIREVAGEFRDASGDTRRDIDIDIRAPSLTVPGDRAQLSQVLHNLVGNSFKYGRSGGKVVIGLRADGPATARLWVADEGDGIAPEHIPRLTERFYRIDPSRSRAQGGTGLGLAIVKHIVERHRGRLDIVSTPHVGTTMSVLLPTVAPVVVTETTQN